MSRTVFRNSNGLDEMILATDNINELVMQLWITICHLEKLDDENNGSNGQDVSMKINIIKHYVDDLISEML